MAKYLYVRPSGIHYFQLRIPAELADRFPSADIRKSLGTRDPKIAVREADRLYKSYQAEFARMRGDEALSASEFQTRAHQVAKTLGSLEFSADYFDDKLTTWARANGFKHREQFEDLEFVEQDLYLDPVDREALRILRRGDQKEKLLSDALTKYAETHKNADNERKMERPKRDWQSLIKVTGDVPIRSITRQNAHTWVKSELARGLLSTSVARAKNNISAIFNVAIQELELKGVANPFHRLPIPNLGKDAVKRKVPSAHELHSILAAIKTDDSLAALIIRMQLGTGTRITEISQLATADVKLDAEVPFIDIKERAWGTVKNDITTPRQVPLVGHVLDAAKVAVKLAGNAEALFACYARERGGDAANATVNKRLAPWGMTSHGFRHAIKDLLRESDCPEAIQKEIMGHSVNESAANYGTGYSLQKKAERLTKALALIQPEKAEDAPIKATQDNPVERAAFEGA